MTTWFTSDLHIGHRNIISYSSRPFASVEEHDEALVTNWNAVVRPGDSIYCLGDFALCDVERATQIAKRLLGQKFYVFGNHDKALRKHEPFVSQWIWARDLTQISPRLASGETQKIILCHYAMRVWASSHHGAWQLYGHSHGSLRDDPNSLQLDVGVDEWDYQPVPLEQITARMSQKTFQPVDHHGTRED